LSFSLFFFFALDGACSDLHITSFLGDSTLMGLNKNEKLQAMAPIKNLSPLLKGKGYHRKNEKILHQYYT
jgi:hypothetical protein